MYLLLGAVPLTFLFYTSLEYVVPLTFLKSILILVCTIWTFGVALQSRLGSFTHFARGDCYRTSRPVHEQRGESDQDTPPDP